MRCFISHLRLPLHTDGADDDHDEESDSAHYPHVGQPPVDDLEVVVAQQVIEGVTEPYGIHGRCDSVGEGEYHPHRSAELGAKGAGDDVVYTSWSKKKTINCGNQEGLGT